MEVADNHGGDMDLAKRFIQIAAEAGVAYVKFQSWQLARLRDPSQEPFYDWIKHAELSDAQHRELQAECRQRGVTFLTSIFDVGRVEFLASLDLPILKVPSPELSHHELLRAVKERFPHLLVSTGMHDAAEVAQAAEVLRGASYTFMHCVSIYPYPSSRANLSRMAWLRQFTDSVGFSDHSNSLEAAKLAIALGATYVERHACLGPDGPGRVNPWDTTPEQWKELAQWVDTVEQAMGVAEGPLGAEELAARKRFIGRWSR